MVFFWGPRERRGGGPADGRDPSHREPRLAPRHNASASRERTTNRRQPWRECKLASRSHGDVVGASAMQKLLLLVDKLAPSSARRSLADRDAHAAHHLEVYSRYALDHRMRGVRRDDHDVRNAVHDGWRLHAREEQPRTRDVLYGFFPRGCKAGSRPHVVHPVLHSGIVAFVWAGYTYAAESWAINEHSHHRSVRRRWALSEPCISIMLIMQRMIRHALRQPARRDSSCRNAR